MQLIIFLDRCNLRSYLRSLSENMELKYMVLMIIKILISVPGVLLVKNETALMGGHLDNNSNETNAYQVDYDVYDQEEYLDSSNNHENSVITTSNCLNSSKKCNDHLSVADK